MPLNMPNPDAVARVGAAGIFGETAANREDLTAFHPSSQYIAMRMLSRRYGLAPSTDAVVAELAYGRAGAA